MTFKERILAKKKEAAKEKAARFPNGNKRRVETAVIKEHVENISSQKIEEAVKNAGLEDDMTESEPKAD